MHIKFWLENLKGRDHSEDLSIDEQIILELILEEVLTRCNLRYHFNNGLISNWCGNEVTKLFLRTIHIRRLNVIKCWNTQLPRHSCELFNLRVCGMMVGL